MTKCYVIQTTDMNDEIDYMFNYKNNSVNYTTNIWEAEKFDEEKAKEIVKNHSNERAEALLLVQYFPRKVGDINQFFYPINGVDFYINIPIKILDKYGLSPMLREQISNYKNGSWDWVLQSSCVTEKFKIKFSKER